MPFLFSAVFASPDYLVWHPQGPARSFGPFDDSSPRCSCLQLARWFCYLSLSLEKLAWGHSRHHRCFASLPPGPGRLLRSGRWRAGCYFELLLTYRGVKAVLGWWCELDKEREERFSSNTHTHSPFHRRVNHVPLSILCFTCGSNSAVMYKCHLECKREKLCVCSNACGCDSCLAVSTWTEQHIQPAPLGSGGSFMAHQHVII